jgi:hypothetical protein
MAKRESITLATNNLAIGQGVVVAVSNVIQVRKLVIIAYQYRRKREAINYRLLIAK